MKYDLNDIDLHGKKDFDLNGNARITTLREQFGCSLPEYENYVMQYGPSELANMVRVYSPDRILDDTQEFREGWDGYFHWGNEDSALTEDDLQECFPIADTWNGDVFVFKKGKKIGIYCLPRDEDTIFFVGDDLQDIVNFAMLSGKLFHLDDYYEGNPPEKLFLSVD